MRLSDEIIPDQREDLTRYGFTGTQEGLTRSQTHGLFNFLYKMRQEIEEEIVGIHGYCKGGDETFSEICGLLGIIRVARPGCDKFGNSPKRAKTPVEFLYDPEPYLLRNRKIVDNCDRLIAGPKGFVEEQRSGTWATVRYARKLERPITIIYPDGKIEHI